MLPQIHEVLIFLWMIGQECLKNIADVSQDLGEYFRLAYTRL